MAYRTTVTAFPIVLAILVASSQTAPIAPTEDDFLHEAFLDEFGKFKLFWKFDSKKIVFEVHVQTTGYVGFGFSPNGGMPGSDIVIGWVKSDGKKRFTDRHASHYGEPRVDDKQDYKLLYGAEIDDHTILKFERKLDTCDDAQDWMITGDTMRLIWAYHPEDPEDDKPLPWHGREMRGSRSVFLLHLQQTNTNTLGDDVYTFEMLNDNVKVPHHQDTTYLCTGIALPKFDGKHHLVKYEPVIQPGNEAVVHHIVVLQCFDYVNESLYHNYTSECFTPNMPEDWHTCTTVAMAWAVGGQPFYFPEKAGMSVGGPGDPTFFMLEVHYDNPDYKDTIYDSSGMRFYYTPDLRQHDAVIFLLGTLIGQGQLIPPQTRSFTQTSYCSSHCTKRALTDPHTNDTTEVHIFSGFLHSHLAGRAIRVRHIRDGVELPNVMVDNHYDFNYQEFRSLKDEVIIQPGDDIIIECEYETMNRQSSTWGGLGTQQEMCLAFFFVYPRTQLLTCETTLLRDYMAGAVGVSVTYGENWVPYVKEPEEYANMSLYDYIDHMNWTDEAKTKLEKAYREGMVYEYCSANNVVEEGDEREAVEFYFPPTVTEPLPDYNRQCDLNDDKDKDKDDDRTNGSSALNQQYASMFVNVIMICTFVMTRGE
ncbi:DBH-like monooxygenase protein 1 homolog [Glandiceps talaboti]